MGKYVGILGAVAVIGAIGFSQGVVEFFFPPRAEVAATSSSPLVGEPAAGSLAYVQAHTQLSHPLGYSVSIRDCLPSGRQCTRERFYSTKADREAE